jgi:hypothetical protein
MLASLVICLVLGAHTNNRTPVPLRSFILWLHLASLASYRLPDLLDLLSLFCRSNERGAAAPL